MISRLLRLVLVATTGLSLAATAKAQLLTVSADFNGKLFGSPGPTYTGQGGNPSAGTFWNGIDFTGNGDASVPTFTTGALTASNGTTPTLITLTLNTPYNFYAELFGTNPNIASNANALMSDWIDGGGGGNTITINNLIPLASYRLYLYGTGVDGTNNPSGSTFTIGGTTQNTFNPGGSHVLTAGVDYTVFTSVTASATGVITVGYTNIFTGMQLTQVPEPSTVAILLAAGCCLLGVMIRRRAHAMPA